jgi:phosphopantothenoylcysteine decarboxylase/phosphopantothenate--cysteine ligase
MANIVLGVSAGIAAYKSADLASKLTQQGDVVKTILTPHALKFVTALTFRAVTRQDVLTDTFEDDPAYRPEHISLADWADLLVIAPATADIIAKLANGLGDTLLAVTALAFDKRVVVAPAMNDRMWANPAVQDNVARLRDRLGYHVVGPADGHLACGSVGPGRLVEPDDLIREIRAALVANTPPA